MEKKLRSYYIKYRESKDSTLEIDVAFEEEIKKVIDERGWNPDYVIIEKTKYPYLGVYKKFFFNKW